jgi:beta-glucosidase
MLWCTVFFVLGVLSVMCAYNRINDVYACQNNDTLSHLRNDLGFEGWIVSDWTATKSTSSSLKAGLDQEMPFGIFYSDFSLNKALNEGKVNVEEIDSRVVNILYSMFVIGLMDSPSSSGNPIANVTSLEHNALAREIASKSIVLLKNDATLLPLDFSALAASTSTSTSSSCIAVFGDEETIAGGGSGHVDPYYIVSPKQGVSNALNERGLSAFISVVYSKGDDASEVLSLASQCSVSLVVVATTSEEGRDRENLSLDSASIDLVNNVASVNPEGTIVAVNSPGAVLLPFSSSIKTLLMNWLPGQEYGNGLADVLFGVINPSARLPITLPNQENEISFSDRQYPGIGLPPEAYYTEELLIGYRWYDAKEVTPLFPFGFGLSYTCFAYSNLIVKQLMEQPVSRFFPNKVVKSSSTFSSRTSYATVVSFEVTVENTGKLEGDEVIQVYLQYPLSAREPPKQLRSFQKVHLKSGATKVASFLLNERDCAIWNVEEHSWEIVPGEYTLHVGSSSRDTRLTSHFWLRS